MKKILSIIMAAAITVSVTLTALPVSAAKKITANTVKELIYSTGLSAYPELWDKTIKTDIEEDVLKPETRTVKDVIDVNKSYRKFFITNSSGKYSISYDDTVTLIFKGLSDSGKTVNINVNTENFILDDLADTVYYAPEIDDLQNTHGLDEDYDRIAEIINAGNITDVTDIKIVMSSNDFFIGSCVYVKDGNNNEYSIPVADNTDRNFKAGGLMSFNDWCAAAQRQGSNDAEEAKFEEIKGDEIRDTDTRAPYIGTKSRFSDVSGDLVSYVNELNDLGIINGYGENLFMPENNITRAEAAAMLARILKYDGHYNNEFDDVAADDWFADDVAALVSAGVINGYDENTFAPNANIKYQEVMKILVLTLGYVSKYDMEFDNFYPSATSKKAMAIGLTDGLKSFDTAAPITRGDMAVMLSNALDTHMRTVVKLIPKNGTGGGVTQQDITLIDYLNGKKLNGTMPEL